MADTIADFIKNSKVSGIDQIRGSLTIDAPLWPRILLLIYLYVTL